MRSVRTLPGIYWNQRREWAERGGVTDGILRFAQDDSSSVILKREALKNPVCRRSCSAYSLFYARDPRVPRRGTTDRPHTRARRD